MDTKYRAIYSIVVSLLGMLVSGTAIGINLQRYLLPMPLVSEIRYNPMPVEPIDDVVSADPRIEVTRPMKIVLRVLGSAEFAVTCDAHGDLQPVACSLPYREPCEIIIPEGMPIMYIPKAGRAVWVNPSPTPYDAIFAHEILHCLKGQWHPPWETIYGLAAPSSDSR